MNSFFLESTTTRDADENIINLANYTYDVRGNLTRILSPPINLISSGSTFIYDEDDNLIGTTSFQSFTRNSNRSSTDITYDISGNLLTETFNSSTSSFGIVISSSRRATITRYSYDDRNNLILQTIDNEIDDIIDSQIEFTYDRRNNLLTQTNVSFNDNNRILVKAYSYDGENNLIAESEDTDLDGNLDLRLTYEYDENNNLITTSTDRDLDGITENIVTNTYDENNNLITIESQSTSDSNSTSFTTNTYDENNNLITSTIDTDGDGAIDRITENTYIEIEGLEIEPIDESHLSLTEVSRFYQYEKGFHFYTADRNEIDSIRARSELGELAYNYEAEKYQVLINNRDTFTGEIIEDVQPVYRFLNTDTGAHLYTSDEVEKNAIEDNLPSYNFESIEYYAFESESEDFETIPVYRLFNHNNGSHLYSSDTNELDYIQQNLSHFSIENNGDAVFYVLEL